MRCIETERLMFQVRLVLQIKSNIRCIETIPGQDVYKRQGYYLYMQKGKEVQIMHQDVIVDYRYHLRKRFQYINVFDRKTEEELYRDYGTVGQMESLLNEILFSK